MHGKSIWNSENPHLVDELYQSVSVSVQWKKSMYRKDSTYFTKQRYFLRWKKFTDHIW